LSPASFLRQLLRETRGSRGRLVFFVTCLAVGVAAVVAVAGFSASLDEAIRERARPLLGADLALRSRQPMPPEVAEALAGLEGAERARSREMLTLVAAEAPDPETGAGRSRLVELKAVEGGYPLYGEIVLDPPRGLPEVLDERAALVDPDLLDRLGLEIGDGLRIGGQSFEIRGAIADEPDRIAGAFSMGPRVMISGAGLERTTLEATGSRILYRELVRLPAERADELDQVAEALEAVLPSESRIRLETYREAQPSLREGLERTESYLALAALLSLLIGGVGVAQTVRAWLAGRMDAIAVLKCIGFRPREVLGLYLGQAAFLGLVGSLAGIALGVLLQVVAARLLAGVLPVPAVDLFQPSAFARGLGLGLGVSLLFSAPPLFAAKRVPPIRVLRRDAEPLPPSRPVVAAIAAAILLGVFAMASWQAGSLVLGALFVAGLLVLTAFLALAAWGLTRLAERPRSATRLWLRHGLAALSRPGASTVGAIVALGLGVLVVLGMFLVERRLSGELSRDLPADAPTIFLIDIQTDQWPGVEEILQERGAESVDSVPVVMGRIDSIDGRSTQEIMAEIEAAEGEARWPLTRELRMTYLDQLAPDNEVTAGELWSKPEVLELSVEEEFARELGVGVGSKVRIDIQGVPLDFEVTSLRRVDWRTFGINFFIVAEPEALEEAPQFRLAAARLPKGREGVVQDALAAEYPNVTLIQIREVLEKVAAMLKQLGLGVQLLGLLTVVAGLAILAGTVSAGSVRRGTEVALLKTLGLTRREVLATFAVEYALVGLVAGLIGAAGAAVLAHFVTTLGFELPAQPQPLFIGGGIVLAALLAIVAGLAASLRALGKRPIEVLRGEMG